MLLLLLMLLLVFCFCCCVVVVVLVVGVNGRTDLFSFCSVRCLQLLPALTLDCPLKTVSVKSSFMNRVALILYCVVVPNGRGTSPDDAERLVILLDQANNSLKYVIICH